MPSTNVSREKGRKEKDHLPHKPLMLVLLPSPRSSCLPPSLVLPVWLLAVKFSNHEMKGVFLIKKRSSGNNKSWYLLSTDSVPGTALMHKLLSSLQQFSIRTTIIISILWRRTLRPSKAKKTCPKPHCWEFKPRPMGSGGHCSAKCGLETAACLCLRDEASIEIEGNP